MKKVLLALFAVANVSLFAQTTESVSMGPSYAEDVYYSFGTRAIITSDNTNWHLAFNTKTVDAAILINEGIGVELFLASTDTSDWATLDTTGMTWDGLHNSASTWAEGAFNANATGHPDYGWGVYNSVTHNVFGSSIYVLKTPSGDYKKVFIKAMLVNGDFEFRIADLDGMNEVNKVVSKSTYNTKNFFYYNVDTDMVIDREPAKTDWDMVVTRYKEEVAPGQYYPVTGVLINPAITAAKAEDTDTTLVDYRNFTQTDSISVIGSNWKAFDMGTFSYVLDDSLSFFVAAQDGNLYKLVFKEFAGSSTGNVVFTTNIASAIGISENTISAVNMYPNPASAFVNITAKTGAEMQIINMAGTVVAADVLVNGENKINLGDFAAGVYIVRVIENNKTSISRLVIK